MTPRRALPRLHLYYELIRLPAYLRFLFLHWSYRSLTWTSPGSTQALPRSDVCRFGSCRARKIPSPAPESRQIMTPAAVAFPRSSPCQPGKRRQFRNSIALSPYGLFLPAYAASACSLPFTLCTAVPGGRLRLTRTGLSPAITHQLSWRTKKLNPR